MLHYFIYWGDRNAQNNLKNPFSHDACIIRKGKEDTATTILQQIQYLTGDSSFLRLLLIPKFCFINLDRITISSIFMAREALTVSYPFVAKTKYRTTQGLGPTSTTSVSWVRKCRNGLADQFWLRISYEGAGSTLARTPGISGPDK